MNGKLPYKTFNLFYSYNADLSFLDRVYRWVSTVGRYIVIGVEMVVLTAFIARFLLDQNLADLTDQINSKNIILSSFSGKEKEFRKIFEKVGEAKQINQLHPSDLIQEIPKIFTLAGSVTSVKVTNIAYSDSLDSSVSSIGNVQQINFVVNSDPAQIPAFESLLNKNILNPKSEDKNPNVIVKLLSVSTSDSKTSYTFKILKIQ